MIICPKKMSTKHFSGVDCTSVLYGCILLLQMYFIYDQGVYIYIKQALCIANNFKFLLNFKSDYFQHSGSESSILSDC